MLDTVLESLPGISLIGCTTAGDFSASYGFSDDSITLILFCSVTIEIRAGIGLNVSRDHKDAVRSSVLRETLPPSTAVAGFYCNGEIAPLSPGDRSFFHNATLVTVLIGERGQEHQDDETIEDESPNRRLSKDSDVPEDHLHEDWKRENEFLKRKLTRSEMYRKRLEEVKDLNASLHRKLIHEIDAAKQEIEKKEKVLHQSEEMYRRIVETAGEGFLLVDENLIITDVNDAYCGMLGFGRNELIGKSPMDLATEDFRQFLVANRENLISEDYRRFEGKLVSKNGVIVPVLVHGNALRDSGGRLLGHTAFVADLSETKKALMLAAEVQRSFLPRASPRMRGLEIAESPLIKETFPGLAQAASEVASPALRNQGTIGGNLQKPRCWYYRGEFHCLRKGGDRCYAMDGENQYHGIFGSDGLCCIAHSSDTAPMLVALGASLRVAGPRGNRLVQVEKFFVLPREDVQKETVLGKGEIVTEVLIPKPLPGLRTSYR